MNKETDLSVCSTVFAVDVKNVTQKLTWVRQAWFGVGYEVSKNALFWFMQTSKDGFVFIFKIVYNFHGGPVVKTLCSQCMGRGFDPWTGKFCTHMAKYIIYIIYVYVYISSLYCKRGILQYYGHLLMTLSPALGSLLAPSSVPGI